MPKNVHHLLATTAFTRESIVARGIKVSWHVDSTRTTAGENPDSKTIAISQQPFQNRTLSIGNLAPRSPMSHRSWDHSRSTAKWRVGGCVHSTSKLLLTLRLLVDFKYCRAPLRFDSRAPVHVWIGEQLPDRARVCMWLCMWLSCAGEQNLPKHNALVKDLHLHPVPDIVRFTYNFLDDISL